MTHLSKKLTARRLGGLLGVAVAATLFSAGALALPSEPAQAATSAELQSQLDAARAELETLDGKIQSATRDLEIAQSDLEQTEVEIETLSKEIEKNEAELAESRSSLSDMMAENYKYDGNMLSFVLGASSFDELTSRVFYANKVSVSLSTLVGEVVSLQDELENQMTQLEERRAQQEEQTKALEQTTQSYQTARSEQASYVESLSQDVQEALEAERQAELERQRQEALAAMQREQEAQQNQAEQNGNSGSSSNNGGSSSNGGGSSSNSGGGSSSNGGGSNSTGGGSSSNGGGSSSGGGSSNSGGGSSSGGGSRPSSIKQAAVNAAMTVLGYPYVTNGDSPSEGFDCSGLVLQCLYATGMNMGVYNPYNHYYLPEQTYNSMNWYRNNTFMVVNLGSIKRGDLLFYSGHVAIYIGGGKIIDAWPGIGVTARSMYAPGAIIGAQRPFVG